MYIEDIFAQNDELEKVEKNKRFSSKIATDYIGFKNIKKFND